MNSAPIVKRVFLSWCHTDQRAKDALVEPLMDDLRILRGIEVEWWEDSQIAIGDDWRLRILDRLEECDYGLLLLSPAFFASSFITEQELPRFVGRAAKGALPVGLKPFPMDGTRTLHGVDRYQVYTLRPAGKFFTETSGPGRARFVQDLASAIRVRILGDHS